MINLFFILVAVLVTIVRFRRDFATGLATAVFFLVLMPTEVRLPAPGALPEITVHRLLLVVAAVAVMRRRGMDAVVPLPAIGLLVLVAIFRVFSTLLAHEFAPALKDFLSFVLETLLYFLIIGVGLRAPGAWRKVAWGILYALIGVACIATVEKYTRINLAARFIPDMLDNPVEITATFRHRILLGYAMAMGFPLALGLWTTAATQRERTVSTIGMLLLPAACYYANSRGAWVGIAMAGAIMTMAGTAVLRKRIILLGAVAVAVLILRPGVWGTIERRWEHTTSTSTIKGRSASYRLELWRVAFKQLSKGAERMAFGYGGHSTQYMDLSSEFEFGGNAGALGYTSWDSEFAVVFMQYGFAGLLTELLVYLILCKRLLDAWRIAPPEFRLLIVACFAVTSVFLWSMTNVAIFNPQLKFLFWTTVALGVTAPQHFLETEVEEEEPAEEKTNEPVDIPASVR